jgi:hypothetical protein
MTTNKKKPEPVSPEPTAPEQPLVIDLPDGQKLVIGQMAAGSVIEVATWRGTGRPDSRTSRLMLGMSPGSLTPTVVVPEGSQSEPTPTKKDFAYYISALKNLPKNLFIKQGASTPQETSPKEKEEKALSIKGDEPKTKRAHFLDFLIRSSHEQAVETTSADEQADIDKWLEEIRSRSNAPKTPAKTSKKTPAPRTKTRKANPPSGKSRNK